VRRIPRFVKPVAPAPKKTEAPRWPQPDSRPMTDEEAVLEARKRWGKYGHVWIHQAQSPERGRHVVYLVGEMGARPYGAGYTWELAFWDSQLETGLRAARMFSDPI
jgi:hypothetical protein